MGPLPCLLQGCVRKVLKDTASFRRRGKNRKDRRVEETEKERVGRRERRPTCFSFAKLTALAKHHL